MATLANDSNEWSTTQQLTWRTFQEFTTPDTTFPHNSERRILIDKLLQSIVVFPDHFEITIAGSPLLIVLPGEVGLKHSENVGVEGRT